MAAAVCDEGDTEIASEDECPEGARCYSNHICCSTVWCVDESDPVQCDALPTCYENEVEVNVCPEGASCRTHSLCGTTILCQVSGCAPDKEPYRHYVGTSVLECALIDYTCPKLTRVFGNDCGCGCEQPESCPAAIDCAPGGALNPLCTSNECPYSPRGL